MGRKFGKGSKKGVAERCLWPEVDAAVIFLRLATEELLREPSSEPGGCRSRSAAEPAGSTWRCGWKRWSFSCARDSVYPGRRDETSCAGGELLPGADMATRGYHLSRERFTSDNVISLFALWRDAGGSRTTTSFAISRLLGESSLMSAEPLIAVFVDFENLAIGVRDMKSGDFEIRLVLRRLLEKGRIVFKRAYCDWRNYADALRDFHAQGIELIDIPQSKMSGKNSADIRMVVDAIDLCYSKNHIDMFALISGDSDFSPLVSKLKENNKRVIGCGVKSSTSDLLIANCDEFIYYDDLSRAAKKTRRAPKKSKTKEDKKDEAVEQLLEVLQSVEQDYDPVWGSALKQAVRRVYPGFNESYYGYSSFSELLQDIASKGLVELEYDESRGNYQIRRKQK